jgi:excisionase family DNA binding protein
MSPSASDGELLTLAEVADRLGVHYMTAYRYLRTGRLRGSKHGSEWRVRSGDVAAFAARGGPAAATADAGGPGGTAGTGGDSSTAGGRARSSRRRTNWAGRAEERMVCGDEAGAWSVIDSALSAGMTLEEVYLELLVPALRSIGDRWATADLSVTDEHVASAIALRLVGRLGPRFARRGRKRGTVVVAAPDGDTHGLPVALFADLVRGRGFRVLDLGCDGPSDSLASVVATTDNLLVVCLGATTPGNEASMVEAIEAVRSVTAAPVLAGGAAVVDDEAARALGADDGGMTTVEALGLIERLPRLLPQPG